MNIGNDLKNSSSPLLFQSKCRLPKILALSLLKALSNSQLAKFEHMNIRAMKSSSVELQSRVLFTYMRRQKRRLAIRAFNKLRLSTIDYQITTPADQFGQQ